MAVTIDDSAVTQKNVILFLALQAQYIHLQVYLWESSLSDSSSTSTCHKGQIKAALCYDGELRKPKTISDAWDLTSGAFRSKLWVDENLPP